MRVLAKKLAPFALLLVTTAAAFAQTGAVELRYKMRKGDHLIYRESFERELKSSGVSFRVRAAFLNHLLVVAEANGAVLAGVQRNRQSSELVEYRERGKDKLADQTKVFAEQTARRPAAFADANLYSPAGSVQAAVQVVREANSKRLYLVSEISPFPQLPVQVGSEWLDERLAQKVRLARFEPAGGENCAVIEDDGSRRDSRLRFWFCPQSGIVRRAEFEFEYPGFRDQRFHEKVTFELAEARHGEGSDQWLTDSQAQEGALQAFLISSGDLESSDAITALLRTAPPSVQSLALAVLAAKGKSPPPDILATLSRSDDAEVRRVALRFSSDGDRTSTTPSGSSGCSTPNRSFQPQKPGTTLRSVEIPGLGTVPYLLRVPIDYRPDQRFPLIVYLSGGAGQALDAALSAEDALRHFGYLALYPQAQGDMWWEPKSTRMISSLLPEILRSLNVDTDHVYLTGFSNGGTGSIYYGTLWPYRFAAISELMGAGLYAAGNSRPWPATNLLNVPMLLIHGEKDDVIPQQASLATFDEIRALHPRTNPELKILKGREHDVTLSSEDGHTLPFFERFERNPFPRKISARISDPNYGRHYWLEVVQQDGPAEIEGRILDDNTVEIKTHNVRTLKLLLRPELFPAQGPIRVRVNGKERFSGEFQKDCALFEKSSRQWDDAMLGYTHEVTVDLAK